MLSSGRHHVLHAVMLETDGLCAGVPPGRPVVAPGSETGRNDVGADLAGADGQLGRQLADDCAASRSGAPDEVELLLQHSCDAAQALEMGRADRGDDGVVRLGDAREPSDLSRLTRAQFQHPHVGLAVSSEDRQREADLVVEVAFRGMYRSLGRERARQHLLHRGLAGRSGHADHARSGPAAVESGEIPECLRGVVHGEQRQPRR